MAVLIRRSEALDRMNKLEEQCAEIGDEAGGKWVVKAFNAIMSCKVQDKVFCTKCGKRIDPKKLTDEEN